MPGDAAVQNVAEMSSVTSSWLHDVGRLLQCVERVIEHSQPAKDAPAEIGSLLPILLPMIRECRAQVPTSEMMEAWLRSFAGARINPSTVAEEFEAVPSHQY